MKEFVVPPILNKRLISHLLSSSSTVRENDNFILKGSQEFSSRANDVFGQLKTLEQNHEAWIGENKALDPVEQNSSLDEPSSSKRSEITPKSPSVRHNYCQRRDFEKKSNEPSDVFKKPQSTVFNRRRINAAKKFLKYGKKWTKYSLADVPLSSNAANASIALSFINELRRSKKSSQEESNESSQITFSKPKHKKCERSFGLSMNNFSSQGSSSTEKLMKCPDTIKLSHLEDDSD